MVSAVHFEYGLGFELYEMLPDAILAVDQQGVIRYANRHAGRLFGQEPATLVSTPVEALMPEHLRERHGAHRARYNLEPRRRMMGKDFDLVAQRADGTTFPVDIMLNPLTHLAEPMTLAVVRDMTERRAAEEALHRTQARLAAIVTSSDDAIVAKTIDGIVTNWNEAAERMYGYSASEMIGQSIRRVVPTDRQAEEDMILGRIARGERVKSFETVRITKDGRAIDVSITVSPIRDEKGRIVGASKIARDVTARKAHQEKIRLLMREANHRVKNILGVVQAIARRTAAGTPEDFVSRFTERIEALAANQELLVRNNWQGVDVEGLARAQLAHFADLIGLRITIDGPMLRLNAAAAQAIGLALHELATNAGKYGALSTDAGRVDIGWGTEGDAFTMSWTERQGPPVSAPKRRGFGTMMMKEMAERSLDCKVDLDYAPSGAAWRLTCPAANALGAQAPCTEIT
jgi:PAS domain S-box-containing protein